MGDYTEHLITQAGGDGEPDQLDLDAIQARADRVAEWRKAFHAPQNSVDYSQRDVPALLALVREQQARIGRVERARKELWDASNDDHWTAETRAVYRDASRAIFAALTATVQR